MHRALRTAELMFGGMTIDSVWHTNGSDYSGAALEHRGRVLGTPPDGGQSEQHRRDPVGKPHDLPPEGQPQWMSGQTRIAMPDR
jgi:hypothetical protein